MKKRGFPSKAIENLSPLFYNKLDLGEETSTIKARCKGVKWACISGRSKLGRNGEDQGRSMPSARLLAALPLRAVAYPLWVPPDRFDLEVNRGRIYFLEKMYFNVKTI